MSLTAAQICSLARTAAKVPGYAAQSGQYLNLVLDDLVLHRDLKVNRVTTSITVQANSNGPFNLELDYLRTYDLFYLVNNMPFVLSPLTTAQYDAIYKDPSVANYPEWWISDLSPLATGSAPTLNIYPQSSSQLSLTHRYMIKRADIATPESSSTVPWFADQDYLVKATAAGLMDLTDDERQPKFRTDCEAMLRTHLIMAADDEQSVVRAVRLDPVRFRSNTYLRPTKTQSL